MLTDGCFVVQSCVYDELHVFDLFAVGDFGFRPLGTCAAYSALGALELAQIRAKRAKIFKGAVIVHDKTYLYETYSEISETGQETRCTSPYHPERIGKLGVFRTDLGERPF